jgi:two-component system cell cycle response regulator DivK
MSSPDARNFEPAAADAPLVLIIDDNAKNVKLARDVLHAAGLRTLEAAGGNEGIALAAERVPDVILLDLHLPDMDGIDVARELRSGARTAEIPVVALSALRIEDDGDWLDDAGFAGYLSKPIDVGTFAGQVRGYCARAGS